MDGTNSELTACISCLLFCRVLLLLFGTGSVVVVVVVVCTYVRALRCVALRTHTCLCVCNSKKASTSGGGGPEGGESDICTICCDRQINCVMVPCGHFAVCLECAKRLKGKPCIMCRRQVDNFQPVYRT